MTTYLPKPTPGSLGGWRAKHKASYRRNKLVALLNQGNTYKSVVLRLNLIATLNKRQNKSVATKAKQDMKWLKQNRNKRGWK